MWLSFGAPCRRNAEVMAQASSTFIARCKAEKLGAPTARAVAGSLLEQAGAAADGTAAAVKERAAALLWARAHINEVEEWEALDADSKDVLSSLYPGAKGSASSTPMGRTRRAVVVNTTPQPSPAKKAAGGGGARDGGLDLQWAAARTRRRSRRRWLRLCRPLSRLGVARREGGHRRGKAAGRRVAEPDP